MVEQTSKQWHCQRKTNAFASERIALIRAQLVANERNVSLAAYQCPACNAWHLSKQILRTPVHRRVFPQDAVTAEIFRYIHGHHARAGRRR
jgi:hypothetical protein